MAKLAADRRNLCYSAENYRRLLIDTVRQRYGSRRAAGAAAQEQMQPLAFNQAFVNLVIRQSKASRLKERTDKPREDLPSAPEPEECVDTAMRVSDLFGSVVRSGTTKLIFLFGKPGTGKTMLMHRICQKWAEGVLHQFLFTFLFEFRQLNLLKRKLTLKELLFDLFLQPAESPDAVFQHLLENAQHTLIIFDGLDEFTGCLMDAGCLEVLASCKNVEHLSFRSRRFGDDFAAALSKSLREMGSLKKLELTGGNITAEGLTNLVQASSQCLQLEEINLQDNRIRDLEVKRVLDLFSRMEKLKKIDLSNNNLSLNAVLILAKEVITCQNATELHVRKDTVIISFSGTSGKVPRSLDLRWEENKECVIPTRHMKLCLRDCSLSLQHAKEIVSILQSCPHLSEVDLSGNKLGDEGCSCLLESLPWISISKQLDLLKSVNTCQKTMEVEASLCHETAVLRFTEDREFASPPHREEPLYPTDDQQVGEEKQTPTLSKKIRLTDCHFQASDLEKLCAVLQECSSISELDLSNNSLGDEGLSRLFQFLPNLKMLRSLKLDNNRISLNSVFCLAQSLSTLEHIKTMNLSLGHMQVVHLSFWERIRDRSTGRLRRNFLVHPKHIANGRCFRLRDCTMGPEDMTRLCQILAHCTQLTEIDLSGNSLSDQSIERLLSFLPYLCHLTLLSIKNSTFSPHCTILFTNSIGLSERIRKVEVRSNQNAFLHLGTSARSQKTSCRLTDCAISQGQIEELCRVLEQHGRLAEVDLSRNQLGDEGLRFLLDHLHRVHVTCSLNLSHNRISQDGVLHLINAFATSRNITEVVVSLCSKATLLMKLTSRDDPRKILSLTECNFQPEHLEKLWLALEKCTSLTEYISSNNNMTVHAAERLLHSLRKTPGPLKIRYSVPVLF